MSPSRGLASYPTYQQKATVFRAFVAERLASERKTVFGPGYGNDVAEFYPLVQIT